MDIRQQKNFTAIRYTVRRQKTTAHATGSAVVRITFGGGHRIVWAPNTDHTTV